VKLVLTLLLLLLAPPLWALKFYPMSITFSPVRGENKLIFVENDSKDPIAIQITVAKREMNLSGEEQHPVTSDFKLFPSQLILKAGQKRAIRLALSQIESTKDEIPYRIIVEQLPIKLKKKKKQGASIKVLFRYIGSLYVTPSESKSDVGVTMTVVDPDQKHLRIRLENRGGRHQILKKLKLMIISGKERLQLTGEQLKGISGENILAKKQREFKLLLPFPHQLDLSKPLQAKIDFAP
jgi:fimbrial chaperone protein